MSYATYNPANLVAGSSGALQSAVLDTMALPNGVVVGPPTGMGTGAVLAAPLSAVPENTSCSFCGTTGGAVAFDPSGHATFYGLSGTTVTGPLTPTGGSVSLGFDPAVTGAAGQRTLVILSGSGAVEAFNGG